MRWYKQGSPHTVKEVSYNTPEEAFEARTEWQGDCLVWTGAKDYDGYGAIWDGSANQGTHKYSWEKVNGKVPFGLYVDHRCHNKSCCNIEHLRLATSSQNGANRVGLVSSNSSGHTNVRIRKSGFEVSLTKDNRFIYVGMFKSIDEALAARDSAREKHFGEFKGNVT